jgi:hypothetical protein
MNNDPDDETVEVTYTPEQHEPDYSIVPDRTISLDKRDYTLGEAFTRAGGIIERQKLRPVGFRETERHYVWKCLNRAAEENS